MQKIIKGKVSFIYFLILLVLINLTFMNFNLWTSESEKLPSTTSLASDYEFDWKTTWGSGYEDIGVEVATDSFNNVYLVGYSDTTGSDNCDIKILKYDPSGVELWSRNWGGINDDKAYDICIDSTDNIIITGYTKSLGDSDGDIVIIKYNTLGTEIWNKTWGGSLFDYGSFIMQDSSGNFFIVGQTKSFGDTTGDALLVKFNSNFEEQWYKTWGGNEPDVANKVEEGTDGYIYMAGHSDSVDPSPGYSDVFLLKYDDNGNYQWERTWGTSYSQRGVSLALDSNDNVYITGYSFGHPASSGKGYLLKYDSSGTYQWERIWGVNGEYGNYFYNIIIDDKDELYISGCTKTYGIPDNYDTLFLNYDTSGNQNWYRFWSGNGFEVTGGICMDSLGNIYLAGYTDTDSAGGYDIIILKYKNTVSSEITIITPENITYTEGMSGYYPAADGFEDELEGTSGTNIDYVDATTISTSCEVQIYDEFQGHKKVLRLHDGNTAGGARAQHNFITTHTTGSIEWWWINPASGSSNMAYHFHEGVMGVHAGRVLMYNNNFQDMNDNIVQPYVANQWYHHKFIFNTFSDTYDWYIDGILRVDDGNFENPVANIGSTNIKGGWSSTGSCYVDAIGYDWDPNYDIGDNFYEGLLLTFTNTTTLDWVGYSLDGSFNITLTKTAVIPFPENGVHSIILSGITSTGTSLKSYIRYFTVSSPELPLPPMPPFTPENPLFMPILLIIIGIGIGVFIGITLLITRRRTSHRTGPAIISPQKYQADENLTSGSDQMKFCPFCGTHLKKTSKFCIYCGVSLTN